MKVVYHEKFREVYSNDPAASPGRIECILEELKNSYEFVEPEPASEEDLKLIHTEAHINYVKRIGVYEIAVLAVGGALKAGEIAVEDEPAFGLIRPPGHHASPDHCWGFCFFNNIAIAVEKLRRLRKVNRVLIVDFDLHYGDGTENAFRGEPNITYYHLPRTNSLEELEKMLSEAKGYDLVAVSAGFDRHVEDWGGMLTTQDYTQIGEAIKRFSEKICDGKRFAVLEGGYNHRVLGKNVRAFLEGFK